MKKVAPRTWTVTAHQLDGTTRVTTYETPATRDPSHDTMYSWTAAAIDADTVSVGVDNMCGRSVMLVRGPRYDEAVKARREALGL